MARAMAAKSGFSRSVPSPTKPAAFISSATKPSVPLLKITTFTGSFCWLERDQVAHQHGEAAVARERDHLAAGLRSLGADGLRQRVGHRAVRQRADEAPPPVHRQIARGPDRRRADVEGEDRIVRRPPRSTSRARYCGWIGFRPGVPGASSSSPCARLRVARKAVVEMPPVGPWPRAWAAAPRSWRPRRRPARDRACSAARASPAGCRPGRSCASVGRNCL